MLAQAQTDRLPSLQLPHVEYSALLPMLILVGGALALLTVVSLMRRRKAVGAYTAFTVLVAGASMAAAWSRWLHVHHHGAYRAVADSIVVDGFSLFFAILIGASVILGALVAHSY